MGKYYISAQTLGENATDEDARALVQLLWEHGVANVEFGEAINEEADAPDPVLWQQCLDAIMGLNALEAYDQGWSGEESALNISLIGFGNRLMVAYDEGKMIAHAMINVYSDNASKYVIVHNRIGSQDAQDTRREYMSTDAELMAAMATIAPHADWDLYDPLTDEPVNGLGELEQ